jgi:hypothetical protein
MMSGERAVIVTAMKNEGPYILEWVAHHLALGFDDFLVFTNDCDDLTDRILDRLERLIPMFHRPNPKALFADRGNWQVMALRYARLFNVYRDAGWVYHTDVDEFLYIRPGAGCLNDLIEAAGPFDVVSFTSMAFNSSGRKKLQDSFVTQQFCQYNKPYAQLRREVSPNARNAIKTLYRNDIEFDMRRNHRPLMKDFSSSGRIWVNGSGTVLSESFVNGVEKSINPLTSIQLAQFNHYAIKSAESFLIKVDRGDVAGAQRLQQSRRYWESYDAFGDDAPEFAETSSAVLKEYLELMSDPLLKEMHEEAFARHQAKARKILASAPGLEMARWLGLDA